MNLCWKNKSPKSQFSKKTAGTFTIGNVFYCIHIKVSAFTHSFPTAWQATSRCHADVQGTTQAQCSKSYTFHDHFIDPLKNSEDRPPFLADTKYNKDIVKDVFARSSFFFKVLKHPSILHSSKPVSKSRVSVFC